MTIFQSLLLGIVEGITEFLPVSSTFHLILAAQLLSLVEDDFLKLFQVVIQFGAILSTLSLYGRSLFSRPIFMRLLLSFFPTSILGFLLYRTVKDVFFSSPMLQLTAFALTGFLFLFAEYVLTRTPSHLHKTLSKLSLKHAVLIGIFQAFAFIPGVSRSGAILLAMMLLGYTRSSSVTYAFMLSFPTITAATALDLYKSQDLLNNLTPSSWLTLGAGVLSSYIFALLSMKFLLRYLSSHTISIFGYYRVILALILFLLLY